MIQKQITNTIETAYHELSIQVSLNGLSFCIRDGITHKIKTLEHYCFSDNPDPKTLTMQFKTYLQEQKAIQGAFKKVLLIHENELSAFVPQSLFNDKQLSDYLKYNVKILETDFMTYDTIKNHELVNVYIPYVNVNNLLFEHFGAFEYQHFSSILVRTILNKITAKTEISMYVHVQKKHFEIVVVHHRKLYFYNTFSYTTKEDFIYHILFTAEQLKLNPEVFPLYLLGAIDKETPEYKLLYTYVRNVLFPEYHSTIPFEEHIALPTPYNEMILLNSF